MRGPLTALSLSLTLPFGPRSLGVAPGAYTLPDWPPADNDITHNNLDLIRSLKEEVAEMKKKEISNEKLMFEIAQENKKVRCDLLRAPASHCESPRGVLGPPTP